MLERQRCITDQTFYLSEKDFNLKTFYRVTKTSKNTCCIKRKVKFSKLLSYYSIKSLIISYCNRKLDVYLLEIASRSNVLIKTANNSKKYLVFLKMVPVVGSGRIDLDHPPSIQQISRTLFHSISSKIPHDGYYLSHYDHFRLKLLTDLTKCWRFFNKYFQKWWHLDGVCILFLVCVGCLRFWNHYWTRFVWKLRFQ